MLKALFFKEAFIDVPSSCTNVSVTVLQLDFNIVRTLLGCHFWKVYFKLEQNVGITMWKRIGQLLLNVACVNETLIKCYSNGRSK